MSSFLKFSSFYQEVSEDILAKVNDYFCENLNAACKNLNVEIKIPQGNGYEYERLIHGKILSAQLWMSRPKLDIPMLMCKFEVSGMDQNGNSFHEFVRESDLITKIPWQSFIATHKFDLKISGGVGVEDIT